MSGADEALVIFGCVAVGIVLALCVYLHERVFLRPKWKAAWKADATARSRKKYLDDMDLYDITYGAEGRYPLHYSDYRPGPCCDTPDIVDRGHMTFCKCCRAAMRKPT